MRLHENWLESFMELTEDTVESPPLFRLWTGIFCVAACLQRKCYLPWGHMTIYPNLYVVLVGSSGRTRKGSAMGPGYNMLRDISIPMAAEAITREALIRELKNVSTVATDPETGRLVSHSSLTIFSQELTVFLGYNNTQLMSDLTDWYDCRDRWTYRTKTQGEDDIIGVWVNLFGATTPDLIQSSLPREAVGSGLTSRIIFVFERDRGKILPLPFLSEREVTLKIQLTSDLEQVSLLNGPFTYDQEFLSAWVDWYSVQHHHLPFSDDRFDGYFSRRPTHLRKLAMVCCAARTDDMILTTADFYRALGILEQTEKKMQNTLSGVGRSPVAELIPRILQHLIIHKETTMEDLLRRFYADADHREITNIIKSLEIMKKVKISLGPNGINRIIFIGAESAELESGKPPGSFHEDFDHDPPQSE